MIEEERQDEQFANRVSANAISAKLLATRGCWLLRCTPHVWFVLIVTGKIRRRKENHLTGFNIIFFLIY